MTTRSRPSRAAAAPPTRPPRPPEIRKTVSTPAAWAGSAPCRVARTGRKVDRLVEAQLRTATTLTSTTSKRQC